MRSRGSCLVLRERLGTREAWVSAFVRTPARGRLVSCATRSLESRPSQGSSLLLPNRPSCPWHCTSRTLNIDNCVGLSNHPKNSVARSWSELPRLHSGSAGAPHPPAPSVPSRVPEAGPCLCPALRPTLRLVLTSRQQPTLRDVADHPCQRFRWESEGVAVGRTACPRGCWPLGPHSGGMVLEAERQEGPVQSKGPPHPRSQVRPHGSLPKT